jgi:hypothetical protein
LLQWFGDLHEAVYGQSIASRKAIRDSYRENISELKCRIFAEYKRRPKTVVRPQKRLVVRYQIDAGTTELVQDTTTITFEGGAASVFGIPDGIGDNSMSWHQFGASDIGASAWALLGACPDGAASVRGGPRDRRHESYCRRVTK